MAALTKADLAEMLFEELGLNKREAREIVEMFYVEISEALEENEGNELTEFEKRLEVDYQLRRAFDLVQGVSLFNEIQE